MRIYSYTHGKEKENSDCEIIISVKRYLREKGHAEGDITVFRDSFGKPHVEGADGIFVSVTHADGLLLVAVAPYPIGIDTEKKDRRIRNAKKLAGRYFCPDEVEKLGENMTDGDFLEMWIAKEALSKLIGKGVPCMKEMSIFSQDVIIEDIYDYDGYITKVSKFVNQQ